MFGYVRVNKPELRVKEFEIYNAVYCGLCRHIGKTYGAVAKLCLSYDMAFISLLQSCLSNGADCFEQKRCRVNPLKKCTYCKNDGQAHELAAAASMALCDMKLRDNVCDSRFPMSLCFKAVRLFTKRKAAKAYRKYPVLESVVSDYFEEQIKVEATDGCSLDKAAEPSAKAVGRILEMLECEEKYKFVLERMGYCLGKWIYLCDVADDLEKDIKKKRFNPLNFEMPSSADHKKYAEQRLVPLMNNCFIECAKYAELLDIKKYKNILDNILYEGLRVRQSEIFNEEHKK